MSKIDYLLIMIDVLNNGYVKHKHDLIGFINENVDGIDP